MFRFKYFTALLLIVLPLFLIQANVFAEFDVSAKSAILMEDSTGHIVFEKNADTPLSPASITKIMTLLVAFEALESGTVKWDDQVRVSEKAWKMEGSRMFLEAGQEVTFGDLITGISVVSANDACIAVAEHLYGSESAFVQVMNRYAEKLDLKNTVFKNTTGLPESGHTMSARDIAILSRHLINKYPKVLEIESMKELTFNNIHQYNRNPLLGVYPGADGLKTGWTDDAGYCLVGTAKQNGTRYISVVLGTTGNEERLTASQELLNFGFKNYTVIEAVTAGEIIGEVPVTNGERLSVPVKTEKGVPVVVPIGRQNDLKKVIVDSGTVNAPVSLDAPVAQLEVRLDGQTLARANLLAAEEMSHASLLQRVWRFIVGQFERIISKWNV